MERAGGTKIGDAIYNGPQLYANGVHNVIYLSLETSLIIIRSFDVLKRICFISVWFFWTKWKQIT